MAVVGLAGLAWLAWVLLGLAGYRHHGAPALKDTVSVLQLVFATVAGAGALVALIVAYRRQKIAEADSVHDRTRVFNERFTAIAAQLGDAQPAVRLAGVHAMAGLADDWKQNRQTCVDVLCAYLRLPYDPDPGDDADPAERTAYRANREVRHTVIRLIGAHLRPGAAVSWQGLNFDFTGVVFDGGDFSGAGSPAARSASTAPCSPAARSASTAPSSPAAEVGFAGARVLRRPVGFDGAGFSGGAVSFDGAKFSGGKVGFDGAEFSGGTVGFGRAEFSGGGRLRRRRVLRRRGRLRRRRVLRRRGRLRRRRVLRRHGQLRRRRVLRRRGQLRRRRVLRRHGQLRRRRVLRRQGRLRRC